MRITCPTCDAAYEVPGERIAPGRGVRCARCGTDWVPLGAAPLVAQAQPAIDAAPAAAAVAALPMPAVAPIQAARQPPAPDALPFPSTLQPRPQRGRVAVAWTASLLVLVGLGWAMYANRAEVIRAWPPSERLYAALGLLPGR